MMDSEHIIPQPESGNTLSPHMEHPPMQESGSPHRLDGDARGSRDNGQLPMGYPPQGYGGQGGYPQYPPQGPYGASYGPPPGPPPGNGYGPPPQGQPYGYPPPMHPPYGYPNYGGPPPGYGYGSGGGYPTQQAQGQDGKGPQQRHDGGKKGKKTSPTRSKSGSPQKTKDDDASTAAPPPAASMKLADDLDSARLRATDSTESGFQEVDPMRTAFHFFVKDNREKYEEQAEVEVRRSTDNVDKFLLFSNLNARIMKAWEDTTQEERDSYMLKEEEDRRRFMSDDEIASRHCATLTARAKSPKASEKKMREERLSRPQRLTPEPVKKEEVSGGGSSNDETKKRASPSAEPNGDHPEESPPKKSRASDDKEDEMPEEEGVKFERESP